MRIALSASATDESPPMNASESLRVQLEFSRSTPEGCREISRGLSERSERYPRSTLTMILLARLRRAGSYYASFTGGLRASRLPPAILLAPLRGAES
jgi:hypothetical protein